MINRKQTEMYRKVGVVQTVVENVDQIGEGNVGTDHFVERKQKQIAHFAIMGIITHDQLKNDIKIIVAYIAHMGNDVLPAIILQLFCREN